MTSAMTATRDSLGIGLYTPHEAAFYARVSTPLLNRWVFGDKRGKSVVAPQIRNQEFDDDRVVTFLDMIQALAIRDIRISFKLPLDRIRQAVERVQDKHNMEYPFAMAHTTYLVSDKQKAGHGEIVIRLKKFESDEDKFEQVSGKKSGNLVIHEAIELYMDELQYGNSGLAEEYRPMQHENETVLLSPHRRFGEPIVESCGYTAQTLWEAALTEGGIEAAASAYGVSGSAVKLAYRYYDHLTNSAV